MAGEPKSAPNSGLEPENEGKPPAGPPPHDELTPELLVPQRSAPALLLSLLFHVILLTTLGLIMARSPQGTGDEADRPVGIALVHRMPDRDRYVDTSTPEQPEVQADTADAQTSSDAAAAAPPADISPPIDLNGILNAMESTPAPVAGTGLAGETDLSGDAFGTDRGKNSPSTGTEATTMVFGVSGSGNRFVYVFDRSDSMNGYGGKPLRAAKREMIRSIKSLTERQRFQIIFYNDKPTPFQVAGMPLQLMSGETNLVSRAERYVQSIRAFGSTQHNEALKMALRMAPDVIFFLTDARIPRLSQLQLAEIQRRAKQSGTTIHAIEFGSEPLAPRDSFLRELAGQNAGQYQYVDVRALPAAQHTAETKSDSASGQEKNP